MRSPLFHAASVHSIPTGEGIALLIALALLTSPLSAQTAKKKPGPDEPSPQTRTFFIEGVQSPAHVKAITDSVMKVKSVTKVEALTPSSGYANISFDHHAVTHQQIAQAIADAGKFQASFRFSIPDYAGNAEKIDAIFDRVKEDVKIVLSDKEKSQFVLTFLPLKKGEAGPHGIGFNLGKIGHPISDPPPKGLGVKIVPINAGLAAKPAAKTPAGKKPTAKKTGTQ